MNSHKSNPPHQYINHQTVDDYLESLASIYFAYDIFDVVRKIQSFGWFENTNNNSSHQRKKIRITQNISLKFDQNAVDEIYIKNNRLYLSVNGIGLLSINSPLPRHLIEYIFERVHLHGDKSWFEFINFLQNRSLYLFYKSWNVAQNFTALDGLNSQNFNDYIASFIGLNAQVSAKSHQYIDIKDKLYFAGFYLSEAKSAKNIVQLLSSYFGVPVAIIQNFGTWHMVDKDDQTSLGKQDIRLGEGLLLGNRLFDKQSKFRLVIGPVDFEIYQLFLKGGLYFKKLKEWMDFLAFSDFDWDYQLVLLRQEVPSIYLNAKNQVGKTAWLGHPLTDTNDMIIFV